MKINLAPLLENLDHNPALVKEIAADFFRDTEQSMQRIKTALNRKNSITLEAEVHKMKGLVSHFDMGRLYETCSFFLEEVRMSPVDWRSYGERYAALHSCLQEFKVCLEAVVKTL